MFQKAYIDYFTELAKNNNNAWFTKNIDRYHNDIKIPFTLFLDDLINEAKTFDPALAATSAEQNVFRLEMNKANKTETFENKRYKNYFSSKLSPKGRNDLSAPYYHIIIGPHKIELNFCFPGLSTRQKQGVRRYISNHLDLFMKLLNSPDLKLYFSEMYGECASRIPKEFKDSHLQYPFLIFNSWNMDSKLDPQLINQAELKNELLKRMKALAPIVDFFRKAYQ